MLVISRKIREGVIIGDVVEVIVLRIAGNQVRLGISGPSGMPIHREEVLSRTDVASNAPAAKSLQPDCLQ